jgi:hypothetical protein
MRRLGIVAVGLALVVVGLTAGCGSSGYSRDDVEGTIAAVRTSDASLLAAVPTATLPPSPSPARIPITRPSATAIRNICDKSTPGPYGLNIGYPAPPPPRYSAQEAVGLVRAVLGQEPECPSQSAPVLGWAAVFDCSGRAWEVAAECFERQAPILNYLPTESGYAIWQVYEDDARVILLSDVAAQLMHP